MSRRRSPRMTKLTEKAKEAQTINKFISKSIPRRVRVKQVGLPSAPVMVNFSKAPILKETPSQNLSDAAEECKSQKQQPEHTDEDYLMKLSPLPERFPVEAFEKCNPGF